MASSVSFTLEDMHQGGPQIEPVLYRIRVPARGARDSHPGPVIRYLTAPSLPKGASYIPDFRGEFLAFEAVPAGDWNLAHLVFSDDKFKDKYVVASTETVQLEEAVGLLDAGPVWCDKKVDAVDLLDTFYVLRDKGQVDVDEDGMPPMDIQCMNHLAALVVPTPDGIDTTVPDVVGIWAWQPGHAHGISNESDIYSIIQARDPGLAPRFLAHITDNGTRVIGFLLERVAGAREAGLEDLEKCRDALSRLHALGIAHSGGLRKSSFLVCGGNKVLLQDFGGAFETSDKEVLSRELESLEKILA
ncbi:hypothetical protein F5Y06DRAFT_265658 [Hypoxylon sp. FL0890]|nr:hypothetical protein F5Y06DRAFT_265658 [Hypoxylon sp. FL0890]